MKRVRGRVDYFLDYGGGSSPEMKMVDYFMDCGGDSSSKIKNGEVWFFLDYGDGNGSSLEMKIGVGEGVSPTNSRYTKVEQKKPDIPINENEIRITSQGLVRNYVSYATTLLQERRGKEIVLKAMGQAISKTVTIAEYIKRNIPRLHQDTQISSISITDVWEPIEEGLFPVEMTRQVSMISITLSTKELNKNSPGYQAPLYVERPRPQYNNYQRQQQQPRNTQQAYNTINEEPYGGNYHGNRGGRGQGGGRGGRGRGWNRGWWGGGGGGGNYQGGGGGGRGYGNYRGGRGYGNYQSGGDYGNNYQSGGGDYGNNYQDNNGYVNRGRGGARGGNAGYRGGGFMRGGGGRGGGRGRGRMGGRSREGGEPQQQ
ncbi:unnamed protein product [Lactuca virosa]|uniref:DNA/RNA-binding protein Alba-like domain-containing protein n=1 Tax=Lactuca virosa TaxID=75947 RepID=A0AAU9MZG7_9ASTR|nr:unnamed protein product [Lactuca virosa]